MSEISKRAMTRRAMLRGSLAAAYPTLLGPKPIPAVMDRSAIALGRNPDAAPVMLPQRARGEHMHVIGTTGGGKSKFLEHCIPPRCSEWGGRSGGRPPWRAPGQLVPVIPHLA